MPSETTDTPRARYHDHFRSEIESVAWAQISGADIDALSVKAIAGELGVSAAALYRYIGSRDQLLDVLAVRAATELVTDVEDVARSTLDCTERVVAIAGCVRRWATEHPGRFALVFRSRDGRPRVPVGVVDAERRVLLMITSACSSATAGAAAPETPSARPRPRPARHRLTEPASDASADTTVEAPADSTTTATTARALGIWTRVLGTVEMELTGHLAELGVDVDDYFEAEIRLAVGAVLPDRVLTLA